MNMIKIITLLAVIAGIHCSTKAPDLTGEPRTVVFHPICPNSICNGRPDGDYDLGTAPTNRFRYNNKDYFDYYFTCANGTSFCRPCAEGNTFFVQDCGQCQTQERIESEDRCHTTLPTGTPLPSPTCPTKSVADTVCANEGAGFCGNLRDFRINSNDPTQIYIGCWMGAYVDCTFCNPGLVFFEKKRWGSNDFDNFGFCEKPGYAF